MGERWDNFRQEMYYATNAISNWWADGDNKFGASVVAVIAVIAGILVYSLGFAAYHAADHAISGTVVLTIKQGNPCINENGLVKAYAPPPCYEDKLSHPPKFTTAPSASSAAEQMLNSAKPADPTYDPPCAKSKLSGCTDQIYSKRLVEGEIYTATFNSDEKTISDDHLQPDFTEVQFLALQDDMEAPSNEKFCGNVLDKFTPGKKFRYVINESKQSDYNGCYVIEVVEFTFGGSPYFAHAKRK